jgi:DHA3 family macrolide efflux protein-like MFS transporter
MTAETAQPEIVTTDAVPAEKGTSPFNYERWQSRFFTIWGGQAISLLGSQLVQFALIWYLTQRTNSAITLTIASLVGLLPNVLLSPLIGTMVDRWNRRLVMIVADTCVALATVALAILFAFSDVQIWHIYLLMFIRAVGGGFHQSAMGASVVLMVPDEHLSRVQGLNQTLYGGLNILSAPLGAVLLGFMSMQGILAIDVLTALGAILPLLFIPIPQPVRQATTASGNGKPTLWQDLVEGFRYVRAWRALLILLGMAMVINFLFTPAAALMPLLVTRHFGGGAIELGWLEASFSAGIIVGGIALGVWGGFRSRIVTALIGLVGLGLGLGLVGLAPADAFWFAVVASVLAGVMNPIVNGSFGAVLQSSIAPEMQGRVFALTLSGSSAMAPLGLIIAGPVAEVIGVRPWYWAGGLVCVLMALACFLIPSVMAFEARPHTVSSNT